MSGLLLDTHALYWLVSGERDLLQEALIAIGESQARGDLFVSPITAWEVAIAVQKGRVGDRPDLGQLPPARWFREAVRAIGAGIIPIRQRIAVDAAHIAASTGHRDPGDCFLMATARVRRISIVTRDAKMQDFAHRDPDFLAVVAC